MRGRSSHGRRSGPGVGVSQPVPAELEHVTLSLRSRTQDPSIGRSPCLTFTPTPAGRLGDKENLSKAHG